MDTEGSFHGRDVKLTTYLYLVPRSRMHGAIRPFPRYAFMTWCSIESTGATLPFTGIPISGRVLTTS